MKSRKLLVIKPRKCPPPCSDLIPYEKELSDMATSLKVRYAKDSFQRELNDDIRKIKCSPNIFVFDGKINNIYEMSKDHHQKLLHDNITKTYQKAQPKLEGSTNITTTYQKTLPKLEASTNL